MKLFTKTALIYGIMLLLTVGIVVTIYLVLSAADEPTNQKSLFIFLVASLIGLVLLSLTQLIVLRKLWNPFYKTLNQLENPNLDGKKIAIENTKIQEFKALNEALNAFSTRTHEEYLSQKQYAENLSHELLTPLAIIRTKSELLLQMPNLTEEAMLNLDSIIKTVGRLTKVNQALILLSKINNNIFVDKEDIDLKELINESLENFEDQIRKKQLIVRVELEQSVVINSNMNLLRVLISNLIKNAVFHNVQEGFIMISLKDHEMIITNSGAPATKSTDEFFQRFVSEQASENSIGLGLSIIRRICLLFDFPIHYSIENREHKISIRFQH